MEVIYENEQVIDIDLTKFHNISDVAYVVKANATDTDENAKVFKTLVDEEITSTNTGIYEVTLLPTDFGTDKLIKDTSYTVFVGIKYENSDKYIEVELNDKILKVVSDGIRG